MRCALIKVLLAVAAFPHAAAIPVIAHRSLPKCREEVAQLLSRFFALGRPLGVFQLGGSTLSM